MSAPEQATFDAWMKERADATRDAGQGRARQADPDTFDEALRAIRALAQLGHEFGADEVRSWITPTSSTGVLGSAFKEARRRGWIEAVGVRTARAVTRHGGLQRTWRGVSPP